MPDGWLLVSFHIGKNDRQLEELWDVPVEMDFLFFMPEEIERRLIDAGFALRKRRVRGPYPGVEAETHRCYIVAQNAGRP